MAKPSSVPFVSRRDFLFSSGAVVVGVSLSASLPQFILAQAAPTSDLGKPLDPHQVDSFLAFHADSSVTIYTSKVDVGTGLRIAVSQMVAEELGIPLEEHITFCIAALRDQADALSLRGTIANQAAAT